MTKAITSRIVLKYFFLLGIICGIGLLIAGALGIREIDWIPTLLNTACSFLGFSLFRKETL